MEAFLRSQKKGRHGNITTTDPHGSRRAARVKTYGDIAVEYEFHAESKCADADGKPCGKPTVGLLQRRHIRVDQIRYIGKESNSLEEVDRGLIHSALNVYTEYPDPRRDEWQTKILPALKQIPLKSLVKECNGKLSRRTLIDLRAGRSRAHPKNQVLLKVIVKKLDEKMHDLKGVRNMPYKNPEDKRRWEREHSAQRNAQRSHSAERPDQRTGEADRQPKK